MGEQGQKPAEDACEDYIYCEKQPAQLFAPDDEETMPYTELCVERIEASN